MVFLKSVQKEENYVIRTMDGMKEQKKTGR